MLLVPQGLVQVEQQVPRELLVLVPMVPLEPLEPRGPPELVLLESQVLLAPLGLVQQEPQEPQSLLVPMLRMYCLLMLEKSPPLMRLPTRSSSGTTAQVS